MVKYLKGQNVLTNDLEGDLNVESDCEGDPMEIGLETSEIKEEKEETRAVLITGSFSAYVRFLPHIDVEMTNRAAGNLCSSIAAQTRSCSLLSNHKVPTPG